MLIKELLLDLELILLSLNKRISFIKLSSFFF
jgi:hypothetical protein